MTVEIDHRKIRYGVDESSLVLYSEADFLADPYRKWYEY
jgi:hypothetical protein